MSDIVRPVVVLFLLLLGNHAMAQADVSRHWVCWYGGETIVYCLLQHASQPIFPATEKAAAGSSTLPEIVHTLWHDPSSLHEKVIAIPLHSMPYDMGFVRQLVQAVMCGSLPACTLGFDSNYADALKMSLSMLKN